MDELLYQYNPWWEDRLLREDIIERSRYSGILRQYLDVRQAVFLTGLRRVGKTTLMRLLINALLDRGVDGKNVLYVSMDDYLLHGRNIFEVLDGYKKLHKITSDEKIWLFLDEITFVKGFQQQLKTLIDRYNVTLFAASSSSSLLRDGKAFLTGRSFTVEVMPLDFEEYKAFKGIVLKKRDANLEESYFRDYIREGGLPENVLHPRRDYLMNLVDTIIQKDITAFHGLKDHSIVRDFFTLLMERSGKQFSINKIANILRLSPDTARRYLNYFVETYLIHLLPRWGTTNERLLSAKKIYACDLGIRHLFIGERDFGSYFENYCYLKLKGNVKLSYVYKNGCEIDFITGNGVLIESKYNDTLSEQRVLFDSYPAKKRLLIDSVRKLPLLDEV